MTPAEKKLIDALSPREAEALQCKASGLTRGETAVKMGVGTNHVKNLWQQIRRKAGTIFRGTKLGESKRSSSRIFRAVRLSELHQV